MRTKKYELPALAKQIATKSKVRPGGYAPELRREVEEHQGWTAVRAPGEWFRHTKCLKDLGVYTIFTEFTSPPTATVADSEIEAKFIRLRNRWIADRGPESSTTRLVMNPAYQSIIGMGAPAVPLLLRELERRVDFWFWALAAITEEDPVPAEMRGNGAEMAKVWLAWGHAKGYKW